MSLFSRKYLLIIIGISTFIACSKSDEILKELTTTSNRIDFTNPQVGQISTYVRYAFNCADGDQTFEWTGDTLLLILSRDHEGYYFTELFMPQSPLYVSGLAQEPLTYPVRFENDVLVIPDRAESALFFFYDNEKLPLKTPPGFGPLLKQNNCFLEHDGVPFEGNEVAQVRQFDLGPLTIFNKLVVSCIPTYLNLQAYLLYDGHELVMTHSLSESEFFDRRSVDVQGWKLIED